MEVTEAMGFIVKNTGQTTTLYLGMHKIRINNLKDVLAIYGITKVNKALNMCLKGLKI